MNCGTEYRGSGREGIPSDIKHSRTIVALHHTSSGTTVLVLLSAQNWKTTGLASNNDVVTYLRMQRPLIEQYSHAWWMNLTCSRLALSSRDIPSILRTPDPFAYNVAMTCFESADLILRQYGTKEGGAWEITMRCRKERKYLRRTFTYGISKTAELLSSWPWRAPVYTWRSASLPALY